MILKLLKSADEAESSDNGDSPEHRRRDLSQSESMDPSSSLVSDDLLLSREAEERNQEEDERREGGRVSDIIGHEEVEEEVGEENVESVSTGRQNKVGGAQLPGLFDEEDPQTNELFSSSS